MYETHCMYCEVCQKFLNPVFTLVVEENTYELTLNPMEAKEHYE